MSNNNFGKFLIAVAAVASACAGTYLYLNKKIEAQTNGDDTTEFSGTVTPVTRNYVNLDLKKELAEEADAEDEACADDNTDSEETSETEDDFKEGLDASDVHVTDKIIGEAQAVASGLADSAQVLAEEVGEEVENFFDDEKK